MVLGGDCSMEVLSLEPTHAAHFRPGIAYMRRMCRYGFHLPWCPPPCCTAWQSAWPLVEAIIQALRPSPAAWYFTAQILGAACTDGVPKASQIYVACKLCKIHPCYLSVANQKQPKHKRIAFALCTRPSLSANFWTFSVQVVRRTRVHVG